MKNPDKDQIAKTYGSNNGQQFETWLRCLNDVRNLCAHHSRLWNRPLVNPPKLPAYGTLPVFDHMIGHVRHETRLYAAVMILRQLLLVINPSTEWRSRLMRCVETLPNDPFVTLDSAGFPVDWTALPAWI
jgi:abortive infection bacteriophage resistance protein